jgi:hypothetical protein
MVSFYVQVLSRFTFSVWSSDNGKKLNLIYLFFSFVSRLSFPKSFPSFPFFPYSKMPQCVSIKPSGLRCTINGALAYDGMCGTHHNQKMRQDPAYAARFVPPPPAEPPVLQRADAVVDVVPIPQADPVPLIVRPAPRVITMRLPGADAPRPPVNQALRRFNVLRRDIIVVRDDLQRLINLGRENFGNDEMFDQLEPRMRQLADLFERIQPLREREDEDLTRIIIDQFNVIRHFIVRANAAAAPAQRRRREQQLADMIRAIVGNEFGGNDPAVFQRDPEGSVNLRAFAQDPQSVHRSSVQEMAQKGVQKILAGLAPARDIDTLFEITVAFTGQSIQWQAPASFESTIQELHPDYEVCEAFGIKYARVIDYLWTFIKTHVERDELTRRFAEELAEGRGMCSNGKMARLVNVVQGYDDAMAVQVAPLREQFQAKIAALAMRPIGERRDAASELFAEYRIPAAEHDAWLEPLLDA